MDKDLKSLYKYVLKHKHVIVDGELVLAPEFIVYIVTTHGQFTPEIESKFYIDPCIL